VEYTKSKSYSHERHTTRYLSAITILPGGDAVEYVSGSTQKSRKVSAPAGMRWMRDGGLLRLRDGMDYHPDGSEVAQGSRALGRIANQAMDQNKALRRERAALIKEEAESEKARARAIKDQIKEQIAAARKAVKGHKLLIGFEDSQAAGNCLIGTQNFAARHGLPNPCPVNRLLAITPANPTEAMQIRGAILSAVRRQAAPMLAVP
jgi:hypothetical protein